MVIHTSVTFRTASFLLATRAYRLPPPLQTVLSFLSFLRNSPHYSQPVAARWEYFATYAVQRSVILFMFTRYAYNPKLNFDPVSRRQFGYRKPRKRHLMLRMQLPATRIEMPEVQVEHGRNTGYGRMILPEAPYANSPAVRGKWARLRVLSEPSSGSGEAQGPKNSEPRDTLSTPVLLPEWSRQQIGTRPAGV
jgi:hypothetical protein